MRCFYLLIFTVFLFSALPAQAENAPVPRSKKQEIESLGTKLGAHEKKKASLEAEIRQIDKDLSGTRNQMVDIGRSIQANEKTLQILEEKIEALETEKEDISARLQRDRKSMAGLILALERIRRVPPEAMIAKPDAPYRTAQSALLMGDIIPSLYKKASELRGSLENLEKISRDLEFKRETALKASKALEGEHAQLAELAKKREKLFADTHADLEAETAAVQRISKQAKSLQDLVSRLNEERERQKLLEERRRAKEEQDAREQKVAVANPPTRIPEAKVPLGQSRLPIAGFIRTRYDQTDSFGSLSKGISIEGREGALVVAPMGGVVRFAGHFKNYGNIVILEHEKGFHSLIAGLEKIDTVVGQTVSAGEALGLLHRAENPGEKPALYYELRLNGRPVNPAMKFADLG